MSFLPSNDLAYLKRKEICFEEKMCQHEEYRYSEQRMLIIKDFELPKDKYDSDKVTIGIRIPDGYPYTQLDMFYCLPPIKLKAENKFPRQTQKLYQINGAVWQRWSRHLPNWKPGRDGIHTIIQVVKQSIEKAQ